MRIYLWILQCSHEFMDDHRYIVDFFLKFSGSITIYAHTIHGNAMFVFNNIQVIRSTIKRTTKWNKCYWLFRRNKYMWKDKQLKIGNIYVRLGNHITITTKGKLCSNIKHMHGRWPTTIQSTIARSLVFTLHMDRNREVITTFQKLNRFRCVLGHFFS